MLLSKINMRITFKSVNSNEILHRENLLKAGPVKELLEWSDDGLFQEDMNSAVNFSFLPLRKNFPLICEYSREQWGSPKSNIKWRFCHDNFRRYCSQIQLQTEKHDPVFLGTLPCKSTGLCKSAFHDICLKTESCKLCKRMGNCKSVCGLLPIFPWTKKRPTQNYSKAGLAALEKGFIKPLHTIVLPL